MSIKESNKRTNYLPALTSLRFLAALHVMLYHVFPIRDLYGWLQATLAYPLVNLLLRGLIYFLSVGYIEVDLFFILSGFILTYTYLDEQSPRRHGARDFAIARIARIFPVYYCAWVFMGLYFACKILMGKAGASPEIPNSQLLISGVASLLCIQSWWPYTVESWNGPGWSVADELFFYALFASMFLSSPKSQVRISTKVVCAIFASTFFAKCAVILAYYFLHLDHLSFAQLMPPFERTHHPYLWWQMLIVYCPIFRVSEFFLGILLARIFMAQRDAGTDRGTPSIIARTPAGFVLTLYAATALLTGAWLPQLAQDLVLIPVKALVIYRLAYPVAPSTGLLSAPMLLLGEASYALYLFHAATAMWVNALLKVDAISGSTLRLGRPLIQLFCAILAIVLSVAIVKLIEVPGRRALRDWLNKLPAVTTAAGESSMLAAPAATMSD
jgi:peptidoglycan/LPS O-acetylase OafA/YrhL